MSEELKLPEVESTKRAKDTDAEPKQDARRTATVILEVWGGMRTTTQAAEALAVSLPRYYHLESDALDGMVQALAPKARGRKSTKRERDELVRERDRFKRECARYQALVRTSQRTIGIRSVSLPSAQAVKGKRRRKPIARALKLASTLQPVPAVLEGSVN